jgi:hypothetical protein
MTGDHNATEEDDNWLDGRAVACPSCGQSLWRVVRSPFYDSWLFYCDRCPKCAEVSYYDDKVKAIHEALLAKADAAFQSQAMYRAIERCLAACDCGGRFSMSAGRRRHQCHAVVLAGPEADGIDLWPHWPGADFGDPTPEEEKAWEAFERAYVKTRELWRHGDP